MDLLEQLRRYVPFNEQEAMDRAELIRLLASGEALYTRDIFTICATIFNDFELALQIPEVNTIKKIMLGCKARGAGMSGSGSAVFAIFTSERKAKQCVEALKADYPKTFLCKPIKNGCAVE